MNIKAVLYKRLDAELVALLSVAACGKSPNYIGQQQGIHSSTLSKHTHIFWQRISQCKKRNSIDLI